MEITDIKWEISRLEKLLDEKRVEYEIFGKTNEDMEADNEIRAKIAELKEKLELLTN